MAAIERPGPGEIAPYYVKYVEHVEVGDLIGALIEASKKTEAVLARIPKDMEAHRYEAGKWTIKEVFQHMVDCERIFNYRALRFARNDATELPGFDENAYALSAATEHRTLNEIAEELRAVRAGTVAFFAGCTSEVVTRTGLANGAWMSVRAIGWTIAGHALHHINVIEDRYLHGQA